MQSIALCCASVHTRILSVGTVLTHKGSRSTTEKGHQLLLISKLQEYRIHGVSAPTHFGSFFFSYIFPIMISHYFSESFLNRLPHCNYLAEWLLHNFLTSGCGSVSHSTCHSENPLLDELSLLTFHKTQSGCLPHTWKLHTFFSFIKTDSILKLLVTIRTIRILHQGYTH